MLIRRTYIENKLEQCNCLTEYEKSILLNALNSAKIDAERLLIYSERGSIIVGKPTKEAREEPFNVDRRLYEFKR